MKVLLLIPHNYDGFLQTISDTFAHLDGEVHLLNRHTILKKWEKQVNGQMFRLPHSLRVKWEGYYFKKINQYYIQEFNRIQPDVVFTYNNEMLLPETISHFKKSARIAFFLGDCPYYTPTNRHFLPLLFHADAVYTTDSFWISALHKLGIKNLNFMYPSIPSQHHEKELSKEEYNKYACEVLYVGMCYKTSWGFKKASFLNAFTDFDLRIHGGESWERWFDHFPKLKEKFHPRTHYITVEQLNDMYNAAKIAPVDANPGLLHAIHWRMLEGLGAGCLPVLEYQEGIKDTFQQLIDVPAVKCFEEAKELTRYYLDNESKRKAKVKEMQGVIQQLYSLEKNADLIKETLLKPGITTTQHKPVH